MVNNHNYSDFFCVHNYEYNKYIFSLYFIKDEFDVQKFCKKTGKPVRIGLKEKNELKEKRQFFSKYLSQ